MDWQSLTNQQLLTPWLAAGWLVCLRGRLLCSCSHWSASLNPSEVIWYWMVESMWPGDLKMAAIRRCPTQCSSSLMVGAWPQLSPRAGTSCDWPPRRRVVIWLVITTAISCLVAILMSCWARLLRRRVLCDRSSKCRRKTNAKLSITRRRTLGLADRKPGSSRSSAKSST